MSNRVQEKVSGPGLTVGVIGLGYVGLPLACSFSEAGVRVIGFDIDAEKTRLLNDGQSYIRQIPAERVAKGVAAKTLEATTDFARAREPDALIICVPTPLTRNREPDLGDIRRTAESLVPYLREGQLVVLESTTYPGTTSEVLTPILERSGLKAGRDFFVGYSPEREDPGNASFHLASVPKVVGADDPGVLEALSALYGRIVPKVVPVSSAATAEAVKLTENIFRAVNIALVNELKVIYDAMGIDVWEVIQAASTKPFGYMPFYPGPGLGGHCIPIDPFYLSWKAREYDQVARFIELAGEINTAMPQHVVNVAVRALSDRRQKAMRGAKVLIVGIAYKKNVDDMRESPSLKIFELLQDLGAEVSYVDPYVPVLPKMRHHPKLRALESIPYPTGSFADYDMAMICTDHDDFDYGVLVRTCPLVVDTRNAIARNGLAAENVVKA